MILETSLLKSALRRASAVSVAALVAASALTAAPIPTFAADTAHATALQVEARVDEIVGALVTVSVTRDPSDRPGLSRVPDNDLLGEFFHRFGDGDGFRDMPFGRRGRAMAPEVVTGSGVVIDEEGLIVTAAALVEASGRIDVETQDGQTLSADLVGQDPVSGLALLRVEVSEALPAAEWSPEALALGQPVFTIGRSEDYGPLLSAGLVAAKTAGGDLLLDDEPSALLLGAPVVDEEGRILAIRTHDGDAASGMIAAVGADAARGIIDEIVDNGTVKRGYLGVSIQPVTPDLSTALGLEDTHGAIVADVQPGTPAEAAGLELGDVILSLDGETVESPAALSRMVGAHDPGEQVRLTVLRDGDEIGIEATLAALPGTDATAEATVGGTSVPELGVSLQKLTPALREAFGLSEDIAGFVVTEVGDEAAGDLQTGDVIVSVYRDPIEELEDISEAADKARSEGRSSLLLLVDRNGGRIFVPVPLAAS